MKMIKSELFLCFALTAFVFVCALTWGSPFLAVRPRAAAVHASEQAQLAVLNGMVLRNGRQFFLRETSGQTFRLDNAQNPQSLEGRQVTVTGTIDAQSRTLHVQRMQSPEDAGVPQR